MVMYVINQTRNVFYLYISDAGSKMSWVDHILCSTTVDKILNMLQFIIYLFNAPIHTSIEI